MGTVPRIRVRSVLSDCSLYRALSDFDPCPAAYFFFGGVLMILGSIGEWIVGNTFPFVVFGTFGKLPISSPLFRLKEQAS